MVLITGTLIACMYIKVAHVQMEDVVFRSKPVSIMCQFGIANRQVKASNIQYVGSSTGTVSMHV